jgi:drug/metabolite transporter (DMT)-like permease
MGIESEDLSPISFSFSLLSSVAFAVAAFGVEEVQQPDNEFTLSLLCLAVSRQTQTPCPLTLLTVALYPAFNTNLEIQTLPLLLMLYSPHRLHTLLQQLLHIVGHLLFNRLQFDWQSLAIRVKIN